MNHHDNIPQRTGLRITKLLIHETGTYEQQWRRPYETRLDARRLEVLKERLGDAENVTPSLLAGVANYFIVPQAQPEKEIYIPQGWGERRLRFMMEVVHEYSLGTHTTEIIMGYTNCIGVNSASLSIDPHMEFYINSTMQLRQRPVRTPLGMENRISVIDSSHVLADNNWTGVYNASRDQKMRPEDVYSAISRSHIAGNDVYDTRTVLTPTAVKSRRANGLAPSYMAGILQNYKAAITAASAGIQGDQDILTEARGLSAEASATRDPFISAVAQLHQMPPSNTFRYGDLLTLDPGVDEVLYVQLMLPVHRASAHQAGQGEHWQASNLQTTMATVLAQAVPGILMELALTRVAFSVTNRTINNVPFFHIASVDGFTNMDVTPLVEIFKQRMEHEVLRDLSFDNTMDYMITMVVNLLGETKITIEHDVNSPVEFVSPSFADSLMTPVVTSNAERVMTMASDFDSLTYEVARSVQVPDFYQTDKIFGQL